MQLPERDELSQTREQLHAQLAIAMGGRVAEEMIFGEDKVTTGALQVTLSRPQKELEQW